MRIETTIFGYKDLAAVPGEYLIEFARLQPRLAGSCASHSYDMACQMLDELLKMPCCIVRRIDTGEELEDTSRVTANCKPGDRFMAKVKGSDSGEYEPYTYLTPIK